MLSDELGLPSREELLAGDLAPGRRASTLLFAIENQTARLVAQSQRATALYLTQKAVEERERAFLEGLAAGRSVLPQPTIQDLERYAAHWQPIVSAADTALRAALAHALGQKYVFTRASVPRIRTALGLDEDAVQRAYQRLYNEALTSIYAPAIPLVARLRWALSRLAESLESLPPFWVAFALTLPVGPGLLALPIALAEVGTLPAMALLLIFGLLNALTAAALAETVARSGTTRYGLGYLGQLVSEYLGGSGSLLLTSVLAVDNFLVLFVFYFGVAGTLESATRVPATVWIAALFAVGLYFLSRKSLSSTVASSLVITLVNTTLLLVIPLFAVPHIDRGNLAHLNLPFVAGRPFDASILSLVFGVVLSNYFSHMLVANYGRVILRRDPSARAWIWGCIAAIGLTALISCLWVLTFNGAIAPQKLARETGTALTALAPLVGPVVNWLGALFVVLSLGMASIHVSLGLLFLVEERLPSDSSGVGSRTRFLLSISPVAAVFFLAEWLAMTGRGSFAGLLGFVGVIALPLLGGIFPVLLLAATRRKGDYVPKLVLRVLGNPVVLTATYLVFLGSIFVYGLFIWTSTAQRVLTLLVGALVAVVTVVMLRRGALSKRVVVELCEDLSRARGHVVRVSAGGHPGEAEVTFDYGDRQERTQLVAGEVTSPEQFTSIAVNLPVTGARELKVWVHRVTAEWNSQPLPAKLRVRCGQEEQEFDLLTTAGQIVLPFDGEACGVEIALPDETAA